MALSTQVAEQTLLDIIPKLPPFRLHQLLDFAKWLQTQPSVDDEFEEKSTLVTFESELEEEDKHWQAFYLENRDEFRAMAAEALAEFEAGETLDMIIRDGEIRPK
ncbi:MAG: hypothetical protein AAF639_01690 [Chloroflexota bacterium]